MWGVIHPRGLRSGALWGTGAVPCTTSGSGVGGACEKQEMTFSPGTLVSGEQALVASAQIW